jgi:hypothetical protein
MSLGDRFKRIGKELGGEPHADGSAELHVGDPRFDDWAVVRDFGELETARAWRQQLTDQGIEAALTADWALDEHGRGDIALRVPRERWSEASDALEPD